MPLLTPESIALLKRMDADEALQAAAMAGWNRAVEAAVKVCESHRAFEWVKNSEGEVVDKPAPTNSIVRKCAEAIRALAKQEEV